MHKNLIILPLVYLLTIIDLFSQVLPQDDQLRQAITRFGQAEVVIQYPGRDAMDFITRNVSISSVKKDDVFITLNTSTVDWFISQGYQYSIIKKPDNKGVTTALSVSQAMDWSIYPSYTQYDSIMRSFHNNYPSLCRLDTIGTSINGRLVLVLKISDNVDIDETEPDVFYSSTMHGDETGGFVLMLRLCDYLLQNYGTIDRVTNMVDNLEIWINPLANPDGTYTTGNTITYPTRTNAIGKDLNRNFPDPFDPGIVPPKENIDMMKFMREHHFVLSANFHAGAEVFNYPWDRWLSKYHADNDWFDHIGRAYADTVHVYSGPYYMDFMDNGVTRGAEWYVVYGGRQDFITWELQGREVTIELDDVKQTPSAQLELLWQNNYRSLLGYLENAMYGIHGLVRDSVTKNSVPAKIAIAGYDKDSSHVYSDTLTGTFTRFLLPGTWDLSVSANGYHDTVISDVVVIDRQKTSLVIELKPVETVIDPVDPGVPLLYPNPASAFLHCRLPEDICGSLNIAIYNLDGKKVEDFPAMANFGIPLDLDLTDLAGGIYYIVFRNSTTGKSYRSRFVVAGRKPL